MNVLCIETSAGEGTLALQCGSKLLSAMIATPQAQAEELIPRIDDLLKRAGIALPQLDAIGFGCGPGSFIGVRLGACVAQGLAAAAGIALAPVSSMAALARHVAPETGPPRDVVVCLDARMGELYWAQYACSADGVVALTPERLLVPEDVQWPPGKDPIATGSGLQAHGRLRAAAEARGYEIAAAAGANALAVLPLARAAVRAGALVAAAQWRGVYLRDETAWKTTQ